MQKVRMKGFMVLAAISVVVLMLSGCATPARHQYMAVSKVDVPNSMHSKSRFKNNLAIETVSGGSKTHPLWTSQVDTKEFQTALQQSLQNTDLYHADPNQARYKMLASLDKLDQPLIGFNFEVKCKASYQVFDNKTNKIVLQREFLTPYTARFSDAYMGVERLKLANEGAVKENIKKFIDEIYKLT